MSIISVEDAKAFLNVTGTDDDALIASLIDAAEAWVGNWLNAPVMSDWKSKADVQHAIKMLIAHWYENREASLVGVSAEEVPFGVWDIINQHREWAF